MQLDQGAPPVGGVGAAGDQALGLEVGDRLRHRLRAHALGGGELADACGAFAVEAPEHRALGEREAVLGAQPADQLAEHDAQLAGEQAVSSVCGHCQSTIPRQTGKLHSLPV